jgi:hypothetical protein
MFGRWCDDEAQDEQEAAATANDDDDDNPFKCNRRTLRLRLDDYLVLLAVLQDEWQTLESSLMSMGRQLAALDQPVVIGTRVKMVGNGIILFRRNIGRRLALRTEIDTRLVSADVTSCDIPIRLEVSPDEGMDRSKG